MRAGDADHLVGRRHEVAALTSVLRAAGRRSARFVAISGEPGIGKTRLLEELGRRGADADHLVLAGSGAELERELPFGVWVAALDEHVAELGPDRLQRILGDRVAELARVLPAARGADGTPPVALPDERYRAHSAARSLLQCLAAVRPLVVLLDDLHWADGASLELLVHLLRRPPHGPLVLGLGFRSGGVPPAVLAALETADRAGRVVDLRLGPLAAADVDALLGEELAAPVRAELAGASGGNPFYLLQLARSGSVAGAEPRAAGEDVPPAVAAALGGEIAALSEPARRLAQGAAVAGEPVDLDLAAVVAGLDDAAALTALDEPVAAGLLRPTSVARRYRFRHPIVRRAIYESAGEGWRLAAHARAAAALAGSASTLAARAQHLERCAAGGDEAALAVLVEAAREAGASAPAGAARWYAAALRILPTGPEHGARRLELLVGLATAQAAIGRLEPALRTLLETLDLIPAELADLRVRVIAACATFENLLGRHTAAHDRLLRALDEMPGSAGALEIELAADALFDTDFAEMARWAEAAQVAVSPLADRTLAAVAAALLCFARYGVGDLEGAEAARAQASAALDALDDGELAMRLDGPYYLGFAEFFCERYDDAIGHLQRGIAVARATGQGQYLIPMMVGLAHSLEMRGQLREALETAQAAVEAERLTGNRQVTSWALVAEGWIAAMAGDLDRARAAGDEAVEILAGLDESLLTLAAHAHVAVIFLEAGLPGRCLEEARVAGAPEFARVEPGRRAWLYAALARADLAREHPDGARAWLDRAERALHDVDLPLARSSVLYARAAVELDGDAAAAAALATDAATAADSVGAVVQAARSRALAGRAQAQAGDREAALETLARAEAELTACGAQRLRDEAARELRRLGRRVTGRQRRSRRGGDVGGLSGRQREIADLVALGRTNREIAAELYLSEKTVEGHLSTVFTKLGVSSRAAVAAAIGRARPV
ncbi:MAG TPA: AAA family ATPase [Solirubrobacteraceae bacterium]|nr:AAA family ATPase [Solirubrobacteraceae bacterium]